MEVSHSSARGGDPMLGTYNIHDLMPKSRDATGPYHNLTPGCGTATATRMPGLPTRLGGTLPKGSTAGAGP